MRSGWSCDVPRKGNVDRNAELRQSAAGRSKTFPARGTWIEISVSVSSPGTSIDVPRKGNVDRNPSPRDYKRHRTDVPRKGNVDRNAEPAEDAKSGVMTFPARGTWIEIR